MQQAWDASKGYSSHYNIDDWLGHMNKSKVNAFAEEVPESIVKEVDPDNLPEGEVVIVLDDRIELGVFTNRYRPVDFTERDGYFDLEFVGLESHPINYIEPKDLIDLITGKDVN